MKKELSGRRGGPRRHAVVGIPRMKAAAAAAGKANGSCGGQLRCCKLVKLLTAVNIGCELRLSQAVNDRCRLRYDTRLTLRISINHADSAVA